MLILALYPNLLNVSYIIRFCFLEQRNTMYGKRQIEGGTYGTIKNKKDVDLVESL